MAIEAVLFDIGGVLERTPRTGWEQRWATELGLSIEEFDRRLGDQRLRSRKTTSDPVGGLTFKEGAEAVADGEPDHATEEAI